jgi:hypothetical protein
MNKLFKDVVAAGSVLLVAAGSVLLKKTYVQFLLVTGATILLYYLTLDVLWILLGLICATVILIRANRRAGGPRGTTNGPAASGPDLHGDGDGDGGGGGNGNGGGNGG